MVDKSSPRLLEAIKKRAERYERNPLIVPLRPSLSSPVRQRCQWRVFRTLADAINEYLQDHRNRVFAYEVEGSSKGGGGRRVYISADYGLFYYYYSQFPPSKRHYYEVIIEGQPCKLYFDIEFDLKLNPDIDGDSVTSSFVELVRWLLLRVLDIQTISSHVMALQSRNTVKFSRHLIFTLTDGTCFKDNLVIGTFVEIIGSVLHLCSCRELGTAETAIVQQLKQDFDVAALDNLRVKKSCSGEIVSTLIYDGGVYNKNRNFRLFRSSKLGRPDELELCEHSKWGGRSNYDIFMEALVCNVDTQTAAKCIEIGDFDKDYLAICERKTSAIMSQGRVCKADMGGSSVEDSPFVEVDNFIRAQIQSDSHKGRIRKWKYFHRSQRMEYEIVGYRYCERLGRHHKSNNIKFIVDLRERIYYQRCFDKDCQNFPSTYKPLPEHTLPWLDLPDTFD